MQIRTAYATEKLRKLKGEYMNKLFVLSGSSGAGKSTLLNRLVKEGICNAAIKYSERKRFNTVDDITTVENIDSPQLQCDIIYSMYGNKYGFSSKQLYTQLQEGNLILITNDKSVIDKLKKRFPQKVVLIYIVSDVNKQLLRRIYIKRHGFPIIKNIEFSLIEQIENTKKMIIENNVEQFFQCIDNINDYIDNLVLQDEEFRLRLNSVKLQGELYSLNLFTYDYTVLNLYSNNTSTIHATESAFDQLKRIIKKEEGE